MKYRPLPDTTVPPISEIGFGLWTLTTGWWGDYAEMDACRLLRRAFEEGVNFFDAADSYGNGRSEELLARTFSDDRDEIVIATKVGYDFYSHPEPRRGERELPQNFTEAFIRNAVERSLQRLGTDRIDVLQLHNIRMSEVENAALWELLKELQREGKILSWGAALGPAIGWLYEGVDFAAGRNANVLQHIYNLFEREPAEAIIQAGEACPRLRHLVRVPHSSGLLEGKYTTDTVFPAHDHRRHRPRSWLLEGVEKVKTLRFLEQPGRTLGQAALQWLLRDARIASCLPNIYDEDQLLEFVRVPDCPPLSEDELKCIEELSAANFGVTPTEPPRFKGTMTRQPSLSVVS
jgi:aryl-alcohol dehydrogenase-like predicted oxidoreductase